MSRAQDEAASRPLPLKWAWWPIDDGQRAMSVALFHAHSDMRGVCVRRTECSAGAGSRVWYSSRRSRSCGGAVPTMRRPPLDSSSVVRNSEDHAVAVGHSVGPARWPAMVHELLDRVPGRFCWAEPRRHARDLVIGARRAAPQELLDPRRTRRARHSRRSAAPARSCRLGRPTAVRDDLNGYVSERLEDPTLTRSAVTPLVRHTPPAPRGSRADSGRGAHWSAVHLSLMCARQTATTFTRVVSEATRKGLRHPWTNRSDR